MIGCGNGGLTPRHCLETRFFNTPTVALIGAETQRFVLVDRYRNFLTTTSTMSRLLLELLQ